MQLNSLDDLFVEQLNDLYSAETQLVEALPKMAKAASTKELKQGFESHLKETKGHVERLEKIFDDIGAKPGGHTCEAMEGLISEGEDVIEQDDAEDAVRDAALIAAAQRVEHYEIAGYGTVRTYAKHLGNDKAAKLLQQTLDEEGETDKKLTKLAESGPHINKMAKNA
jgi:ferritin-like metal-binding protein YciE